MLEDMKVAMEVERPVRTRSDLEELPVVGPAFGVACDMQDFVWSNTQFVAKYVGCVPFLFAVSTMVGTINTVWSLKRSASVVLVTASTLLGTK